MATSPVADNYIENIKTQAFAGYSTAGTSMRPVVPDPLADDDKNRSFLRFRIGGGSGGSQPSSSPSEEEGQVSGDDPAANQDILGQTLQGIGVPDPRPDKDFPDTIAGYIESKITDYMGFKTAVNPLTQTERVTGPPKAFSMFMGMPMMAMVTLGAKASQANLENIQEQAIAGKPGYSVGLLNGQIVGMSPGPLGYGSVQSGMYGTAPPGLTQAQHEQNVQAALEAHATEIEKGKSIPDITGTYNENTFGSPDGSNALANTTGKVFSYTQNPFGKPGMMRNPVMTKENLPVTMGGFSSSDFGFDPDFGYDPHDDTTPSMAVDMFDDPIEASYDTPPGIGPGPATPSAEDSEGVDDPEGFGTGPGEIGGLSHAAGGRIGMQSGGTAVTEGFVNKDPDSVSDDMSIADNRYTSVKVGSFVVNQPANEANEKMLDKIVGDAKKRTKMKRGGKAGMVDVALSDGERLIEPEVVATIEKKHGKGFLDKINDAGKPEVKRRQARYGEKIGAANGGLQANRGFVQQLIGPDSPTLTSPAPEGSTPLNLNPVSPDNDQFFGRNFGDIKRAIQNVEIKGFEKDPYIFTGIKVKGKASSAFGPMQITASTLKDVRDRSPLYNMLDQGGKEYVDLLIQQGDDKVNIEKYGSMYRNKKRVNTPAEVKKYYRKYGKGNIPQELHEKYYETIANITLRQKLKDHKSLEKALASYGEGDSYAQKVLRGLD